MHAGDIAHPRAARATIALVCSVMLHAGVIVSSKSGPQAPSAGSNPLEVSFSNLEAEPAERVSPPGKSPAPDPPKTTTSLTEPSRYAGPVIPQREPDNAPADSTETRYFLSSEVDVPAEPVSRPSIIYPEHALLSRLSGTVRARIFIDLDGRVNSIEIVELRPPYQPFEEIAINALIETQFSPAKRFGKPVNSQKIVEVFFNPYEDNAGQR